MAKEMSMKMDGDAGAKEPLRIEIAADSGRQPDPFGGAGELQKKLQRHIASTLGLPVQFVTPFTRFGEDLGLNVWSTLELVLSLEALLGVQLPDAQAAQVNSVKDFVDGLASTTSGFSRR